MSFENSYDEELMQELKQGIENRQFIKSQNKPVHEQFKENWANFDKGRHLYEEYDPISNEIKMKVDFLYYTRFFDKLDDYYKTHLESSMTELYKTINAIYEHVNIKPAIYGVNITPEILNDGLDTASSKVSKVIYEFLERNFYSLSKDERKKKYFDSSLEESKKLIIEGTKPEEAISFGIKTAVMETLLTNISFPFAEWTRINYLCENADYGDIFDQETLIDLVGSFKNRIHNISKIVAVCV